MYVLSYSRRSEDAGTLRLRWKGTDEVFSGVAWTNGTEVPIVGISDSR